MNHTRSARRTILLIEDNLDHAELIRRTLQNHELSCTFTHLTDGDSALEYLFAAEAARGTDHPLPDLILLDIRLPRRNGIEVLRIIREREGLTHIPVVILTTSSSLDDIRDAYHLHANSYIVKPFDFQEFRAVLEDMGIYWLFWNEPGPPPAD